MSAAKGRAWAAIVAGVIVAAGCGQPDGNGASGAEPVNPVTLRRVLLPDLSGMAARVQERIRSAHAAVGVTDGGAMSAPAALGAAYGELGNLFFAIDYFGSAEVCYDNARTLAPLESRWSYYLGHAYRHLGNLEKSAGAFNLALQMEPSYIPARVWMGEMALAGGRPELARLAFTAVLSWRPQSQAALFGRGRVALEQRDYATAADDLRRALAVDSRVSAIRYPLALAYRGLGRIAEADAHLRERGGVQPVIPDPWMEDIERLLEDLRADATRR